MKTAIKIKHKMVLVNIKKVFIILQCSYKLSFMKKIFSCTCSKLCIKSGYNSVSLCESVCNPLDGLLGQWYGVSETWGFNPKTYAASCLFSLSPSLSLCLSHSLSNTLKKSGLASFCNGFIYHERMLCSSFLCVFVCDESVSNLCVRA